MEGAARYTAQHPEHHNQEYISETITAMEKQGKATFVPSNSTPPSGDVFTFRQLSPMLFATGCRFYKEDYFKRMSEAGLPAVIMHFNCIGKANKKKERMKSYNMWYVTESNASCKGNVNCYGEAGKRWLSCKAR